MTRVMIYECHGQKRGCHKRLEMPFKNLDQVEDLVQARGWVQRGEQDLCPVCNDAAVRRHPKCPNCTHPSEFSDALGHDRLGHGIANALAAVGIRTWEELERLSAADLVDMPRMGKTGAALVQLVQLSRGQSDPHECARVDT